MGAQDAMFQSGINSLKSQRDPAYNQFTKSAQSDNCGHKLLEDKIVPRKNTKILIRIAFSSLFMWLDDD